MKGEVSREILEESSLFFLILQGFNYKTELSFKFPSTPFPVVVFRLLRVLV